MARTQRHSCLVFENISETPQYFPTTGAATRPDFPYPLLAERPVISDLIGHVASLQERIQPTFVLVVVNGWLPCVQDIGQDGR